MHRWVLGLSCCAVIGIIAYWSNAPRGIAKEPSEGLPGAIEAVDAARFRTLQEALDVLPPQGGVLRLPAGTIEITQPLIVRSDDVCIEGAGAATHIKNLNRQGQPALLLAHAEHAGAGDDRDHELWRIRLADFRVTGNDDSGPGILAKNVNEIFIDGVTVSHHGGDGILLSYCYEDPRICDSLVTYNRGTGLNLQGCHDIVVSSNQFEENQDAVHCFDSYNLCMTGNCLDDHLGHGVIIENTYGSVVSGNMIEECQGTAIVLDRDCYGITLSANVIAHNGAGIDLRDAHGCAVSANTFTIVKSNALRVASQSGRIAVSGNSFSSSFIGDGLDRRDADDRSAAGVSLELASSVLVDSNVFSGLDSRAIAVTGDQPSVVSNNLVVDTDPGVRVIEIHGTVQQSNHAD